MKRRLFFCQVLLTLLTLLASPALVRAAPAVALFYGSDAPYDELKAFDIVVLDPDHNPAPEALRKPYSEPYAYVAVGEAHPTRPYFKDIPEAARLAVNKEWGSLIIDLSHPGWAEFFAAQVIAPLWEKGYRGFFLDTLDSYRLADKFNEAAQQGGLVSVIETLHRRFPGIRLILNRGFEVLPKVRDKVYMVAAESLFQGWDAAAKRYVEIKEEDRAWLLGELIKVRDTYGLPVLAIDYVAPQDRALTRATAERIKALGIIPWVSDSALGTLGIGQREVVPRKILMLYSGQEAPLVHQTQIVRFATMPLQHMGYVTEHLEITRPLPERNLAGEVAGIVLWINGPVANPRVLSNWLRKQMGAGIKTVIFGQFPSALASHMATLGLESSQPVGAGGRATIRFQDPMLGFETPVRAERAEVQPIRLRAGGAERNRPLLRLEDTRGATHDAAAITPWGGYVLNPYAISQIPGTEQTRWIIDPFAFLQAALALPDVPVPDTTTENGRRLMFIHIDGDGFPSLSERAGAPIAGRVLLEQVLKRYRLPTTMSVIEGEVAPHGMFPQLSTEMENVARQIFALPYVEIASHTYSHPFDWLQVSLGQEPASGEADYHLPIAGYRANLEREIVGSTEYIRKNLAPAEKPVRILQWSGDSEPEEKALRLAVQAGLLNLNGGNTIITRSYPSLTAVSALGVNLGGVFQTYAPIMNENVFTNLWTGPFYGFERVIETFQMTGTPRRLKPINIYHHSYSASKTASLNALHKVYAWALAQSPHVIFASEFIRKTLDFNVIVLARENGDWRIRGNGDLRTMRAPASLGRPDVTASRAVAGYHPGAEGNYVHLAGDDALLRFSANPATPSTPHLHEANARIAGWQPEGDTLRFSLNGHQPLEFSLAANPRCNVSANGKPVKPRRVSGDLLEFRLNDAAATIETRCRDH